MPTPRTAHLNRVAQQPALCKLGSTKYTQPPPRTPVRHPGGVCRARTDKAPLLQPARTSSPASPARNFLRVRSMSVVCPYVSVRVRACPLPCPYDVRSMSGVCPVTVRLLSGYCPVTVRLLSGLLSVDVQMDQTRSKHPPLGECGIFNDLVKQ